MGWAQQVRPYGEERWWALALPVALLVVLAAGAFALLSRRDLGAGLVPDRPGPADAPRALLSPAGLAWRLNRASVIGWVIGAAVAGAGVGSLGDAVNEAMSDDEGTADMLGQLAGTGAGSLVDSYYAAMMNVFGVLAAGFVVQALLRLRGEEAGGTAEAVLATAVGRFRWTAAHLVCTVAGAAAMLLAAGAAAGVADAVVGGDAGVGTLIGAGLVQLPAALAVAGFVLLAFGGLPRLTVALAWAGLTFSIVCGLLGDLFGLPQAVRDLSPFSHVPAIPAADPAVVPLLALVAVAAVLAAAGMSLFRRRDLTA
jgi:ABC-2 type transport system permease protein